MRLLIAEDDADIAKALTALFEHHSYSTDTVFNGLDACEYACGGEYDGIIMDIMMPGMDGLEAAQAILEEHPDARIIMVSSLAYDDTFEEAKAIGAKGFIDKPFEKEQLLEAFGKVLNGESM